MYWDDTPTRPIDNELSQTNIFFSHLAAIKIVDDFEVELLLALPLRLCWVAQISGNLHVTCTEMTSIEDIHGFDNLKFILKIAFLT